MNYPLTSGVSGQRKVWIVPCHITSSKSCDVDYYKALTLSMLQAPVGHAKSMDHKNPQHAKG